MEAFLAACEKHREVFHDILFYSTCMLLITFLIVETIVKKKQ
jgi:hypothetical protein